MIKKIREFFRKKDERLVAFYYEGNPSISKDGLPYIKMYYCYENDVGVCRIVSSGIFKSKDKRLLNTLKLWKKGKILIPAIPSYNAIGKGEPYKGHQEWEKISATFPSDYGFNACVSTY